MIIENREELKKYLSDIKKIGLGSQGTVYYDHNLKKVVKIFHCDYEESFDIIFPNGFDNILKFKECKNDTYKFALDSVILNEKIIGYISELAPGDLLCNINPLQVNYNNFMNKVISSVKDVEKISQYKIESFDVIYNMMYGNNKLSIIDQDDYNISTKSYEEIYKKNILQFNRGIMLFLVDSFFDNFVKNNVLLKELYKSDDSNIKDFLVLFKKYLSEYVGKEIETLSDANKVLDNWQFSKKYIRMFK